MCFCHFTVALLLLWLLLWPLLWLLLSEKSTRGSENGGAGAETDADQEAHKRYEVLQFRCVFLPDKIQEMTGAEVFAHQASYHPATILSSLLLGLVF